MQGASITAAARPPGRRLGLLLACLLSMPAWGPGLPGQGTGPEARPGAGLLRVGVVADPAHPTARSLIRGLQRTRPEWSFTELPTGEREHLERSLAGWDQRAGAVLLAVGGRLGHVAATGTERIPLVVAGPLDAWPERSGAGLRGGPDGRVRRVDLRFARGTLRRALAELLPGIKRVGVVTAPAASRVVPAHGAAPTTLRLVAEEDLGVPELLRLWRPQIQALLIPDQPELVSRASEVVTEARRAGLKVVTTAPWLARSGAHVGVEPDLGLAVLRLASALAAAPGGPRHSGRMPLPARLVADPAALEGLPPERLTIPARFLGVVPGELL